MVVNKTKERNEVGLLEAYKGKWVNLYFDKDGGSFLGVTARATEGAALQWSIYAMMRYDTLMCACGTVILVSEISHVIQMPIGE